MTAEPQPNLNLTKDSRFPGWSLGGLALLGGVGLIALWPSLKGFWTFHTAMSDRTVVLEETSPDAAYRLVVESSPPWIYGPHGIHVYQAVKGRRKPVLGTMLYNDGANLFDGNVGLTWQSDRQALLRLDGEEQEPACHLLTLGKPPIAQEVPCPAVDDEAGEKPELIPESPIVQKP